MRTPSMPAPFPAYVALGTAAALAWPVHGGLIDVRLAITAVTGALGVAGISRASRRSFLTACAMLAAMAVAQRPFEPMVGLAVAIGLTLVARPAGDAVTSRAVPIVVAALTLGTPDELPLPRWAAELAVVLVAVGAAARWVRGSAARGWVDLFTSSPAQLMVTSFAALGAGGAALLWLPISARAGHSIRAIDALFTSVSASCVTGLAVLDTPTVFSRFGQLVILGLIQLGGLGIMSFATAAAALLGRRVGVKQESVAASLLGDPSARADLDAALWTVFRVTAVTEAVGAAALFPLFLQHGDGPGEAAWRALFTSISAFCNAGFALQSASLIPYADSPGVLLVVSIVIALGGIGPAAVTAMRLQRRGPRPLQVRLALATSAALTVVPAIAFLVFEWNHTLSGMTLVDRLTNAWFQSVTLRTAGFNSIDFAAIQPATWTLCLLCMFVGGSPGSTAGGIKTTTLAISLLAVRAAIRGQEDVVAFGRRIAPKTVLEASSIIAVFLFATLGALAALQLTQDIPTDRALFEVVSALATVGLSMGATAELDAVGKLIIIVCMFAGRIGPLTLFIWLLGRERTFERYPLESVQVG